MSGAHSRASVVINNIIPRGIATLALLLIFLANATAGRSADDVMRLLRSNDAFQRTCAETAVEGTCSTFDLWIPVSRLSAVVLSAPSCLPGHSYLTEKSITRQIYQPHIIYLSILDD